MAADVNPDDTPNVIKVSPKKQALLKIQQLKRALADLERTVKSIQEAPKVKPKAKTAGAS